MLGALLEAGISPELVLGTSVGALNGAAIAAQPDLAMVDRMEEVWLGLRGEPVFGGSMFAAAGNLIRSRTSLHPNTRLGEMIERILPVRRFEDLAVPFQCVASSIERATEHWFTEGPLVDAILASTAVPGLFPPVRVGDEHFLDGGLVNSIPVQRAVELGATEIFVLHVGRIEQPLASPANLLRSAVVAFEIARRNRFARDMASLPDGVVAHVLPTGGGEEPSRARPLQQLRYRDVEGVETRIRRAREASAAFLAALDRPAR